MGIKSFLPEIIATVTAFVLLWLSKRIIKKILFSSGQRLQKSELRIKQIRRIFYIFLNILFIVTVFIIWIGKNNLVGVLTSVFAILGVALFAQWSIISNITAGLIMFFSAPFRVGDHIRIIDKDVPIEAIIEKIETFYTHIRTPDNELIVIPNNLFLQKMVSVKE